MATIGKTAKDMIDDYLTFQNITPPGSADERAAGLIAINEGYRKFLGGRYIRDDGSRGVHIWSFVNKAATIDYVASDSDYDLPDDFGGIIEPFLYDYDTDVYKTPITKISVVKMMKFYRDSDTEDTPKYYTIRNKDFVVTTGTRYEVLFYPVPDAVLTVNYRYRMQAADLTDSATVYPVGLADHCRLIVQGARAYYEFANAQVLTAETGRFERMMYEAVMQDMTQLPFEDIQTSLAEVSTGMEEY